MTPPKTAGVPLEVFFREMSGFLRAEVSSEELAERIGPTTSADERMLFYQELIGGNWARNLNSLYPGVRAFMDADGPASWERTVRLYRDHRRTNHWDLNQYGAALAAHFAERREAGEELPAVLDELADYEWLFFVASRSTETFDPKVQALNPTAILRRYTHRIPHFVSAVRRKEKATLQESAITIFLYREPRELSVRYLEADLPALICFAALLGEASPDTIAQSGASEELLQTAADHLIRAGILGSPSRDALQALFQ